MKDEGKIVRKVRYIPTFQMLSIVLLFAGVILLSGVELQLNSNGDNKFNYKLPLDDGVFVTQFSNSLIAVFLVFKNLNNPDDDVRFNFNQAYKSRREESS